MTQDAETTPLDPAVRKYRPAQPAEAKVELVPAALKELGGRRDGTEPTRFGDWEKQGRCIDF
ncbi:MAG TPA: DUF1674 domain-containing protein [Verrucomicrobiae bacterium]|nr:DUF1674 domain-containing protein [Verrucomicrobiae bacterium]